MRGVGYVRFERLVQMAEEEVNNVAASPSEASAANRIGSVVGGAALGFGIWAASPALTGQAEPWDADFPYYLTTSVIGGAALGLLFPRHLLRSYFGAWSGQFLAFAVLPDLDRDWLPLSVVTTAIGSLLILLGAAIGRLPRQARKEGGDG